jgi:HSP20 family protein
MARPARRPMPAALRAMFPDPPPGWPESPWAAVLAFSSAQTFRVEELVRDDQYVIRAELPGLDPATNIEVTVDGRTLTIHADRSRPNDQPLRTEFRYGSVTRSVRLPARVDAHDITARYRDGILEVSMPVPAPKPGGTRIPIENETYKPGQVVPRDGTVECVRHPDVQDHVKAGTRFAPCSHHHEHSEGCIWQYV